MTTPRTLWSTRFTGLVIGLLGLAVACSVTVVVPPADDGDGTELSGSDTTNGDGTSTGGGGSTDGTDDGGATSGDGNPNSPCADQTNVYVLYVNESAARVVFVENFRDDANQVVSGAILVLQAAGDADDTRDRCITCPYQAGIRNIKYAQDGAQTSVPYPDDLFRGEFRCGDQITFTFKASGSVSTSVTTP
jgi:hypothetical protein